MGHGFPGLSFACREPVEPVEGSLARNGRGVAHRCHRSANRYRSAGPLWGLKATSHEEEAEECRAKTRSYLSFSTDHPSAMRATPPKKRIRLHTALPVP